MLLALLVLQYWPSCPLSVRLTRYSIRTDFIPTPGVYQTCCIFHVQPHRGLLLGPLVLHLALGIPDVMGGQPPGMEVYDDAFSFKPGIWHNQRDRGVIMAGDGTDYHCQRSGPHLLHNARYQRGIRRSPVGLLPDPDFKFIFPVFW